MGTYEVMAEIKIKLTDEDIEDIMVGALEGGIGYWSVLDNTGEAYESAPVDEPVSITCAKQLLSGETIRFEDVDGDAEYFLDLHSFLDGFKKWVETGGDWYGAVSADGKVDVCNIDADRADAIIQYAIFGDVIFG